MSKLILLFLVMVLGLVFLIPMETIAVKRFFFSNVQITLQTYIYFVCEKLVLIILVWIIVAEETKYRWACKVFFWLMVIDLVDFFATYNSIWFRLAGLPVSMNIVKCTIFGLIVAKEWITLKY